METVGGLMAKQLNKVPIAGSVVNYGGLELVAERGTGRRNKIGTVIATWSPVTARTSDARRTGPTAGRLAEWTPPTRIAEDPRPSKLDQARAS